MFSLGMTVQHMGALAALKNLKTQPEGMSMSFFHHSHQGSLSLVIETLSDEW